MSFEFPATLRRLKLEKYRHPFIPRAESELEFLASGNYRPAKLLYDTTVYVDILQDRFPTCRVLSGKIQGDAAWLNRFNLSGLLRVHQQQARVGGQVENLSYGFALNSGCPGEMPKRSRSYADEKGHFTREAARPAFTGFSSM